MKRNHGGPGRIDVAALGSGVANDRLSRLSDLAAAGRLLITLLVIGVLGAAVLATVTVGVADILARVEH